ncbi:ABC transporter ATP-binding protein [Variovorax sp. WS11]|uniref:ABC transporter ATP-binding protein n=1 Tax=Variovorax sp. WS11 TaxID=1105204 RepID=UPI001EF2CF15|nr:ABC transporter ATP-binding protein [Variovorax sp. WS11]
MTTLTLEKVSKRFGGVIAAEDVNLRATSGRVTGIIGPNGAGKTTLVNLITGMTTLSSGGIRLDGLDLSRSSADAVGRAGVARTFQNIRLQTDASVLDNVMIGFQRLETSSVIADLLGLPSSRRETARTRNNARSLLEEFGMSRYAQHPAGSLAYGHQRRVEMMRAFAAKPRVLLLDEPVAGMNDVEAEELGALFRDLADSGVAVVVIEHNMRFITSISDYLYVLDRGRIIAEGEPREVLTSSCVIEAYLGN